MKNQLNAFSQFNKLFFYISAGLLIFVVVFNLIVDPLDVYRLIEIKGVNELKPKISKYTRISKPTQTENFQARSLVLGSSRAEYGINMSHPVWRLAGGAPALNNAVTGASIYDIYRFFQHAVNVAPVKTVVIGLDFYMFNVYRTEYRSINESVLAVKASGDRNIDYKVNQFMLTLLSKGVISASFSTIKKQSEGYRKFTKEGQRINLRRINYNLHKKGGYYKLFTNDVRGLAYEMWTHCNDNRYSYQGNGEDSMLIFKKLMVLAKKNNIQLKLFISPSHAWLSEEMDTMKLWGKFEQWKRDLVGAVASVNKNREGPKINLWDFSGYTKYTTEKVPEDGDTESIMRWYIDPSHYRDTLGDLLLNEMFMERPKLQAGVQLYVGNIEEHLINIRKNRSYFREKNKAVVVWATALSKEVLEAKKKNQMVCH